MLYSACLCYAVTWPNIAGFNSIMANVRCPKFGFICGPILISLWNTFGSWNTLKYWTWLSTSMLFFCYSGRSIDFIFLDNLSIWIPTQSLKTTVLGEKGVCLFLQRREFGSAKETMTCECTMALGKLKSHYVFIYLSLVHWFVGDWEKTTVCSLDFWRGWSANFGGITQK